MEKRVNATNVYMNIFYFGILIDRDSVQIFFEILTSIATLAAVFVALYLPSAQKKAAFEASKEALKSELLYNLTQIFTGEVERPVPYGSYDYFVSNFIDMVKDTKNLSKIQFIYSQFRYYDRYIQSFFLTDKRDPRLSTEKQLQTYNHIFEILELKKIEYEMGILQGSNGTEYIIGLRDKQINNFNKHLEFISNKIKEVVNNI